MRKIVVYTAVIGEYDIVLDPVINTEGVEYVLFTDSSAPVFAWQVRPIDRTVATGNPLINRWYKVFAHKLFPDADISIYLDGNIRILKNLDCLLKEFDESGAAIGLFTHMERQDIYEEVAACRQLNKFDAQDEKLIDSQLGFYESSGFPADQKLTDNGIIFRKHHQLGLYQAMELWWEQLNTYTKRDQISLPFAIWRFEVPAKVWQWSFRPQNNGFFLTYRHQKKKTIVNLVLVKLSATRTSSMISAMLLNVLIWTRSIFVRLFKLSR